MKFTKIMGKELKENKALIEQAEKKLSQLFMNLAVGYSNRNVGDGWGGDLLVFSLMQPVEQVATLSIKTAATCGKRFYWNPNFVLKQSMHGLRLIALHEAFHALYLHPSRVGSRNPKLWNIAVDYIVNGGAMEDVKARGMDPKETFQKQLGKYMTLPEYAELLKDPFKKKAGFEAELTPTKGKKGKKVKLPDPNEDRDLTEDEIKQLEQEESRAKFFFADPELADEMKRPERIYDYLYQILPKCEECGRLGIYKRPKNDKKKDPNGKDQDDQDQKDQEGSEKKQSKGKKNKDKDGSSSGAKSPSQKGKKGKDKGDGESDSEGDDQSDDHEHGENGSPCDHNCGHDHGNNSGDGEGDGQDQDGDGQGKNPGQQGSGDCDHGGCSTCGGDDGVDVFDFGGLVDDHMDTSESEEKLSKRFREAVEAAKKMAGHIPAGLEDELGILSAPKVSWKDEIRGRFRRAREGNQRNDYTRFKTRPLAAGLMTPKRKTYTVNAGVLLDTSGSMSQDDMALGISQLQSLDERNEIIVVYCDCQVYFDQAVKIKKFDVAELSSKIKPVGRGGTQFLRFFDEYEQHIGKCDFLIVMSDMYLDMTDVASWKDPGVPVYFLCTSGNTSFEPPFGKLLQLK